MLVGRVVAGSVTKGSDLGETLADSHPFFDARFSCRELTRFMRICSRLDDARQNGLKGGIKPRFTAHDRAVDLPHSHRRVL